MAATAMLEPLVESLNALSAALDGFGPDSDFPTQQLGGYPNVKYDLTGQYANNVEQQLAAAVAAMAAQHSQLPPYHRAVIGNQGFSWVKPNGVSPMQPQEPRVPQPVARMHVGKELTLDPLLPERVTLGDAEMKSCGGKGHPYDCTECSFFFFGTNGCREGKDCQFCHEFHVRKSGKKTRRMIRRLQSKGFEDLSAGASMEGDLSSDLLARQSSELSTASVSTACSSAYQPSTDSTEERKMVKAPRNIEKTVPSHSIKVGKVVATKQATSAPPTSLSQGRSGAEVLTISYTQKTGNNLTAFVGVRTKISPELFFASEESKNGLQSMLLFSVQPPLPSGFALDTATGAIEGLPVAERSDSMMYSVTASVVANTVQGLSLGAVPIATCALNLRVLALDKIVVSEIGSVVSKKGGSNRLLFGVEVMKTSTEERGSS